jgi:hypothetical protein
LSRRQPRQLNRRTAIHDHLEPSRKRPPGRSLVDHAELEPDALCADGDRFVNVRARLSARRKMSTTSTDSGMAVTVG